MSNKRFFVSQRREEVEPCGDERRLTLGESLTVNK